MAHPFLASRDFRALFLGDVVVTIAERYFVLTFSWWLLSGPEASGQRLSLLLALESVPMLAVGLLAGPLIERANKKHAYRRQWKSGGKRPDQRETDGISQAQLRRIRRALL